MAIREKSFRIGCGRYVQEAGALAMTADEVLRLGKSPVVVGGKTALSLTRDAIEGGRTARFAKEQIELTLGKPVLTSENALDFTKSLLTTKEKAPN